jgi:hypothetical protein
MPIFHVIDLFFILENGCDSKLAKKTLISARGVKKTPSKAEGAGHAHKRRPTYPDAFGLLEFPILRLLLI